ncbi:hypothetical protein BJV78DRAFT_1218448, partial [Lactifluus subvellereus]
MQAQRHLTHRYSSPPQSQCCLGRCPSHLPAGRPDGAAVMQRTHCSNGRCHALPLCPPHAVRASAAAQNRQRVCAQGAASRPWGTTAAMGAMTRTPATIQTAPRLQRARAMICRVPLCPHQHFFQGTTTTTCQHELRRQRLQNLQVFFFQPMFIVLYLDHTLNNWDIRLHD